MKIICFGRNYAKHAKEMNSAVPSVPIFFMKPDTALLKENNFYFPEFTKELHYEVEIVLKITKNGKHISRENASKYYDQFSLGIDFTARDIQKICKENGLPWEKAKSFDNSAFLSNTWLDMTNPINFSLEKNGKTVQMGSTKDLLFSFDELIAHLSQYVTLKQGDLIYTGTPEGVGPVSIGDELKGFVDKQEMFSLKIK